MSLEEMDEESAAALPDREAMSLLDLALNLDLALDLAAPVDAAVAANANVAAPIDAAVAANIGSVGSEATAVAAQVVDQRARQVMPGRGAGIRDLFPAPVRNGYNRPWTCALRYIPYRGMV